MITRTFVQGAPPGLHSLLHPVHNARVGMEAAPAGILATSGGTRLLHPGKRNDNPMKKLLCLMTLALVLVPASVAGAQGVENTYRGETDVLGEIGEVNEAQPSQSAPQPESSPAPAAAPAPAPAQAAGGTLPFTGAEVLIVALGGLALLGGGFALRRLSSGGHQA